MNWQLIQGIQASNRPVTLSAGGSGSTTCMGMGKKGGAKIWLGSVVANIGEASVLFVTSQRADYQKFLITSSENGAVPTSKLCCSTSCCPFPVPEVTMRTLKPQQSGSHILMYLCITKVEMRLSPSHFLVSLPPPLPGELV